jgi:hypothetical protein
VAVYDMHDNRRGDVVATTGNHVVVLNPGHHVTMAYRHISAFEQINPLECIGHRKLHVSEASGNIKHFTSEFSLISALNGLKPFMQMKHSTNPRDVKLVKAMIKNAAIIMQTRSVNGSYQRISSPRSYLSAQR